MAKDNNSKYSKKYSEEGFFDKLVGYAKSAGSEVVETALKLYYAMENPKTPAWAKTTIIGALGYFISPIDAIPDMIPVVGYTDDLSVLAAAASTVAMYINDDVKKKAKAKMKDWFG